MRFSENKNAAAAVASILVASCFLGCGEDGSPGSSTGPTNTETRVNAVVAGASNISDGIISNSVAESETAAISLGTSFAVAYNAVQVPTSGERCQGYGGVGMTYAPHMSPWSAIHFSPPSNIGALVSDPSIAMWDNGSSFSVFVSVLAQSVGQWTNAPKTHDNCVSQATWESFHEDYVCVFTVNVPKYNGSPAAGATVTNTLCQGGGGLTFDGTALTVYNGQPIVASVSNPFIVYYAHGNNMQSIVPFGTPGYAMAGHPIWTKNAPFQMFAPDFNGYLWTINYQPATDTWSTSSRVPGGGFVQGVNEPYGIRGGKEYAAVYVPGSAGPGAVYVFYQRRGGQIVGYSQSTGGIPGWSQFYTSDSRYAAFHPAVAVAAVPNQYPPYTGYHMALTYWDNSASSGNLALRYTTSFNGTAATLATEKPCVSWDGYWGDYDEMFVEGNNSPSYYFFRAFTDSTKQTCSPGSDWSPSTVQHVSIITPPGGH